MHEDLKRRTFKRKKCREFAGQKEMKEINTHGALIRHVLCLSIGVSGLSNPILSKPVVVFKASSTHCYRIPSMIQTRNGILLAFAEQREGSCSDLSNSTLVLRRSVDLGLSWSDIITIYEPSSASYNNPSNANPVEILFPNGTSAVLLHFDTKNNPSTEEHGVDEQIYSFDQGLTWSSSTIIEYPPLTNNGGLIGPSVGIIQNETIFFTTRFNGSTYLYWSSQRINNDTTLASLSWEASSSAQRQVDECSIAPLGNDSILANCRTSNHERAQFTFSLPDGTPSVIDWRIDLPDPNCQGSLLRVRTDDIYSQSSDIFFLSNNNSTEQRANMTVRSSLNSAQTWDSGTLVWPQNSGYSQLTRIQDYDNKVQQNSKLVLGLLFERGHNISDPSAYHDDISFLTLTYSPLRRRLDLDD